MLLPPDRDSTSDGQENFHFRASEELLLLPLTSKSPLPHQQPFSATDDDDDQCVIWLPKGDKLRLFFLKNGLQLVKEPLMVNQTSC